MAADSEAGCVALTRREFFGRVESSALMVTGAAGIGRSMLPLLLAACGGARYARSTIEGNRISVERSEFATVDWALVDAPGSALPVHVHRKDDGSFAAVSTRCMHRGCQVDRAGTRFVCPCHGSEYTIEGDVLKGPTQRPLVRFRTTSDDSRVFVHLDRPLAPGESA